MHIVAYCTKQALEAVRSATGVEPLTSPPLTASLIKPEQIECDFLYVRLHGVATVTVWFGEDENDNMIPALNRSIVRAADMTGSVVLVANCYGDQLPLVDDFYHSGAEAVIVAGGDNYAAGRRVIGTDKIAKNMIKSLKRGVGPKRALRNAKIRMIPTLWRYADRDALGFKIRRT